MIQVTIAPVTNWRLGQRNDGERFGYVIKTSFRCASSLYFITLQYTISAQPE